MDKYLGKKLEGRYEILEIIGIGGMANVYRARDLIEDRTVAVKILRDEYLTNEEFLRRFRNESKAISVLSHPNIVKVYDVCFSDKMQSIVMEYVDGITLKEYIEQQGVLRWKDAVHFVVQILRALQHAHEKGIVHRDIKPQNIMLLSDGTIKVTDFGIARFSRSETRTLTDKAIGSVHYISPEQASGEATDEKADLYSVGVMLYEMLTGRLPFEADSPVSVALKQIQSQARRPRELNPSIPEGLEAITMRAMQKNPARRYGSAAEMLRDIDEFKRNPSIHFAYKYLDGEESQLEQRRVGEAIQHTRQRQSAPNRQHSVPYVAVLTGITAAFVLVTLAFVGIMIYLNNPFVSVGEVKAPNLVGVRYDQIKNDPRFDDVRLSSRVKPTTTITPKGSSVRSGPRRARTSSWAAQLPSR
jgi:serine/threonine-protein kinase